MIPAYSKDKIFVSISPSMTEIMYALDAQDMLYAVSSTCSYPKEAKTKPVIGDAFFVNSDLLMKIKPDYFLGPDSSEFMLSRFKPFGIIPLCFKYETVNDIYKNILELGKLTGKEKRADELIAFMREKIKKAKENNPHKGLRILYLVQASPLMTIGKKSFITDIIEASGNISVTSSLNTYYPTILEEYAIEQKPDVIVLDYHSAITHRLEVLFPNTPIVKITREQADIIDRPGPRIYKSVEYFSSLKY